MTETLPAERPVDLVIFDCDGVLIDSEVIAIRCLVDRLAAMTSSIDFESASRQFVGRGWDGIRRVIEADIGRPLPDGFEEDVEEEIMVEMTSSLMPITGIAAVLDRLELPRCVASGSSIEWITLGLGKTGLLDHLAPHLFSATMVENGKPAPDVFLHAAKEMGVAPSAAVIVEDSLPGVEAGVAAGAVVIGFTGGSHILDKAAHSGALAAAGASLVIERMELLPAVIAGEQPLER